MRVYSLNRAIYRGSVEREFYLFCLLREPRLLRYLPGQLAALLRYRFGTLSRTGLCEALYQYLPGIGSFEARLDGFWSRRRLYRLKKRFLIRRRERDVLLSGAPACLLEPLRRHLGVRHLLASAVDPATGRCTGLSCHGAEQLRRLRQSFPGEPIEEFWTARRSEAPVAEQAAVRRILSFGRLMDWDAYQARLARRRRFLRACVTPEFLRLP